MPVTAIPRGMIQNRQARPLTGLEIGEAIEKKLMKLADQILNKEGFLTDKIALLTENFRQTIKTDLQKQPRLQRMNVTYPKVGWNVKVRLERYETNNGEKLEYFSLNGEAELDLERNVRFNLQFGESGLGVVVASLEDETIPTATPDNIRNDLGMPMEATFQKPDGTVGTVDIRELRAARTVDVGSGAPDRVPKMIPSAEEGQIRLKEVMMSGGEQGLLIQTPDQLPEVTLDDGSEMTPRQIINVEELLAIVPEPPKEPPKDVPLPPKGISKSSRPDVRLKK